MPRFRAPTISALIALLGLAVFAPSQASAVILSAGDLVVAERSGPAIIRVVPATAVLSSGGSLDDPLAIALESTGQIVVADPDANAIIRVNPVDGSQVVVSAGGNFGNLRSLAIEGSGAIVVTDGIAGIIRVDPNDGTQTVVSYGGILGSPLGIAVDVNGTLVVIGYDNRGVFLVDPNDGTQTLLSSGGNFHSPREVAIDGSGNVLVADVNFGVIRVDPNGVQTVVSSGFHPKGIAIDAAGNIFVVDAATPGVEGVFRVDPASGTRTVVSSLESLGGGILVVPGVVFIPTLPQWGLIVFAALLLGTSFLILRARLSGQT